MGYTKEGVAGFGLWVIVCQFLISEYILFPEVQVNCFLHLVTLYNIDAIPFIYSEKVAWAAKKIATVLL